MQIIQLIISLSLLVVIHEMGHFIFARLFGVRVERFSLFFGKPILRYKPKRSETEYVVGWLPFGGYVELSGMIDESLNVEQMKQPPQPWEFRTKPAWQRLLIMVGGVCFNLILAFFIYAMILFKWGDTYVPLDNSKYGMEFNERAEAIGFRDGDVLVSADGKAFERYDADMLRAIVDADKVTVLRNGNEVTITMPEEMSLLDFNKDTQPFIDFYVPMVLDSIIPKSGAAYAGLQQGDSIISVNGYPAHSWTMFTGILKQLATQEKEGVIVNHDLTVVYNRSGRMDTVTVCTDANFMVGVSASDLRPFTPNRQIGIYLASRLIIARYISTSPVLSKAPPIISVNQCTPETSRPTTIKTINAVIKNGTVFLSAVFLILLLNCIIAVGITHITSRVVDEG